MKEVIKKLRTLNELDLKIQTVRKDIDRIPKALVLIEDDVRMAREKLERRKQEVMKVKTEADSVELDLKSGEEALKRYANQMNLMRTSKEFDVIKRQMEAQRMFNRQTEDKALELIKQAEDKEKENKELASGVAAMETKLEGERTRVNKEMGELKTQLEQLNAERAPLAEKIPVKERTVYDRIVATRGQAIALLKGNLCSSCFMQLPPQVQNLTLLAQELVICPSCGRILAVE